MLQPVRKNRAEANNVDTTKWKYTLLLDMNNIMKISFVDRRFGENKIEYGMFYEAIRIIGNVLDKKDFNFCVACYDGHDSGILRYEYYKPYKANRGKNYGKTDYEKGGDEFARYILSKGKVKKIGASGESDEDSFERQALLLKNVLEELCVRQYEYESVEGDDIIANYVKNKDNDEKVVIVSTDKDITQLISETVVIYNPREHQFITDKDSAEKIGIRHDNIVLEKMLCGDTSDNIKGIRGVGEGTLLKHFPEFKERKIELNEVLDGCKKILEERKASKKKPLQAIENIVNRVTEGVQGKDIYEINRKIIDLSEPILTKEAIEDMRDTMHCPIDTDDRKIENVYAILRDSGINDLLDEKIFGQLFGHFNRIMTMERRYFKEFQK